MDDAALTADQCVAEGIVLVVGCDTCSVVRELNPGWLVKRGRGAEALWPRFLAGRIRCSRCNTPTRWVKVNRRSPSSLQETELWLWTRR